MVPENPLADLKTRLLKKFQAEPAVQDVNPIRLKEARPQLERLLNTLLTAENVVLSRAEQQRLFESMIDDTFGFGPLAPLLEDTEVSEILVDGPDRVYVERRGKLVDVDIRFKDNAHLLEIIRRIIEPMGQAVDDKRPMLDVRLPDGSRVNVVIPPVALNGPTLTIRKFTTDPLTIDDLIRFGSIPAEIVVFLAACIKARLNILISGGTGSGKTTLLNVLASLIPDDERIIAIEGAAELQLKHRRVVRLETRPANLEGKEAVTARDLLANSLKMRPDRLVVGEIVGEEALGYLQAINGGHDGSMTTIHANDPRDALNRLETMVLLHNPSVPVLNVREIITSAIDVIVQQNWLRDGSRKVLKISEVQGMQGDLIVISGIFEFEQTGISREGKITGRLLPTGRIPHFLERFSAAGLELSPDLFTPLAAVEKIRVLVVDDSAETRENLAKILQVEADMEVVALAASGEEGLDLAGKYRPEVVLMDSQMAGMDGFAATRALLQAAPAAQVIMMAVEPGADYPEQAHRAGAREYLVKPFSATELIAAIHRVYELGSQGTSPAD